MAQLNRSDCPVLRDQVSMPVAASWELRPMPRGAKSSRSKAVHGWSDMYIIIALNYHQRVKAIDLQV